MDLLDFFRGSLPWTKLWRFLAQVPDGSRYRASQAMDLDLAEHILEVEDETGGVAAQSADEGPILRSSAGYDLNVQVLMTIADLIQQLNATLIAVNLPPDKSPPKIHPLPRPVSAVEVVRARRERADLATQLEVFGI
ncbi:hypothetical protein [Nocardia pseudobrasiliensis]|uniref:Uncharacterized protein n=1 Tax=Nocardia pseudobrasiliensis TaxID=45979 RepID=A0A370I8P3_9NOCA|nr:hypothetical protein [Nocardia pseudobrasiliensis]RDI65764.1 hypothetical protein DFR76_10579 [Nocardia pseudobrasiliensis]